MTQLSSMIVVISVNSFESVRAVDRKNKPMMSGLDINSNKLLVQNLPLLRADLSDVASLSTVNNVSYRILPLWHPVKLIFTEHVQSYIPNNLLFCSCWS